MPYVKETYITGAVIETIKKFTYTCKNKKMNRQPKENPTSEIQKKFNEKQAIKKLRRLINNNFKYGDAHVVLSYASEHKPATPQQAKENLEKFIRKLRTVYKQQAKILKYVATTEYGKNSLHHHLIINAVELNTITRLWQYGRPNITPLDRSGQYEKLANYLVKQTSKTFNDPERQVHKKRWCASSSLIVPQPIIEIISASSWTKYPKTPKGYKLEKCYADVHDITGYPFQFYSMVKIPEEDYPASKK